MQPDPQGQRTPTPTPIPAPALTLRRLARTRRLPSTTQPQPQPQRRRGEAQQGGDTISFPAPNHQPDQPPSPKPDAGRFLSSIYVGVPLQTSPNQAPNPNPFFKSLFRFTKREGTNKGAWSKQEDQKLIDYINIHGEGCWHSLPKAAGLERCGKSCRLRWINYLRPDIKRGNFAQDEEDLIIKLHALLGNRWSLIAGRLPGRTDNEVKNYWNSHIRKKLIRMGIDPNNHKLHQHLPCLRTPHQTPVSFVAHSPESKKSNASRKQSPSSKSHGKNHANEGTAASEYTGLSYINEDTSQIVNLNLELTIAMPMDPGK